MPDGYIILRKNYTSATFSSHNIIGIEILVRFFQQKSSKSRIFGLKKKIIRSIKNTEVQIHSWNLHCVHSLLHTCTTTSEPVSKQSQTESRIRIHKTTTTYKRKYEIDRKEEKKRLGIEKTLWNGLGFSAFSLFQIRTKKLCHSHCISAKMFKLR